jgi:4-hydroxy-2-oxoheptanedioate aldolase
MENLEEILAVPGFDMVCFGPGDFAHRTGNPGATTSAAVRAARRRVARSARLHGKFVMAAGSPESPAMLAREGHTLFTVAADIISLGNSLQRDLQTFSSALGRRPSRGASSGKTASPRRSAGVRSGA